MCGAIHSASLRMFIFFPSSLLSASPALVVVCRCDNKKGLRMASFSFLASLVSLLVFRGLELQGAQAAVKNSDRYLIADSIAEQRNSRLVSFMHIVELVRTLSGVC